jgi:1-acyl-sn-glycerol-3-phosphate acyltransferase
VFLHYDKAKDCLSEAENRLKENISVLFFPEGTRSRDGNIGNFKLGAFILSKNTNIPILPIEIKGSRDIVEAKTFKVKPGNVVVSIKDKIDPNNFNDIQEFLDNARNLYLHSS